MSRAVSSTRRRPVAAVAAAVALVLALFTAAGLTGADAPHGGPAQPASAALLVAPAAHPALTPALGRDWLRVDQIPQAFALAAVLLALLLFGLGRFAPGTYGSATTARYPAPRAWGERAPPAQSAR